jgi:hypothetical protein
MSWFMSCMAFTIRSGRDSRMAAFPHRPETHPMRIARHRTAVHRQLRRLRGGPAGRLSCDARPISRGQAGNQSVARPAGPGGGRAAPRFGDDEHAAGLGAAQRLLPDAQAAQPFGARTFEVFQVVRIEDHAAGIGIFPVHPHRPGKIRASPVGTRAAVIRSAFTASRWCRRPAAAASSQQAPQALDGQHELAIELALERRMKRAVCAVAEIPPWCHRQMGLLAAAQMPAPSCHGHTQPGAGGGAVCPDVERAIGQHRHPRIRPICSRAGTK